MQILSSKLTFFYKYVFIFIWLIGFGVGTREVIFVHPQFDTRWVQYFLCWTIIAVFIYFATGTIKVVALNRKKKQIEISNFFKTVTINFSEIEDIDGSSLLSPKLVWLILKDNCIFGKKISFMPANRPTRSIGKHPLVMELRKEFNLDR
ncbi:MAG: hypothetical protein WBB19_16580 [Desulforhopalus sp.]